MSNVPLGHRIVEAIRAGDVAGLEALISDDPDLVSAPLDSAGRTPLHIATDWPGYFPNGPQIVQSLLAAGADPNARTTVPAAPETPLHWAASTDDLEVAAALIDGGADLDAAGGSIGTPLANAVGYGCWHVARLLVERGATVETLWQAAALGLLPHVEQMMTQPARPSQTEINNAFWHACHGGQRRTAEYLLSQGADPNAIPAYATQSAAEAAASDTRRQLLQDWLRSRTP